METEQTLVNRYNQENETSGNAQSVDDESSRSEKLKSMLKVMRREIKSTVCADRFPLWSRFPMHYLLNSKVKDFTKKIITLLIILKKVGRNLG